jgi:hypothetical protein
MIRTASKSKNSHDAWDLSIFIGSAAHLTGGRFALSAGFPAAQQKMGERAGGQAFTCVSAVIFENLEPVRIQAK